MRSTVRVAVGTVAFTVLPGDIPSTTREITTMPVATENLTVRSTDGAEISYDKTGAGPVLILVAGASQYRSINPTFAELGRVLGDQFTVINYDRRGRGLSKDAEPYAVQKEVDDIGALIAANGGRASLLGFSSGAILAIEAAVAGLPVDKVIAYEPPFVVEGSGVDPNRSHLVPKLEAALASGDRREVTRIFFVESVGIPAAQYEGMMNSPAGKGIEAIAHTLIYDSKIADAAYPNQKWPERFRTNKVPTLLLNGDKTFPMIPYGVDALHKALGNSSRKTLPGQDHGVKAEAIAPAVRAFLKPEGT
jgi:pimeloyl-ACP methyl ester carboxylesterase